MTFGVLAAILIGWFVSLKRSLVLSQKLAVTIGYFIASGYIISVLFNRYSLMSELIRDIERLATSDTSSHLLIKLVSFTSYYRHHEILILTSYVFITAIFGYVIWSGVANRDSIDER